MEENTLNDTESFAVDDWDNSETMHAAAMVQHQDWEIQRERSCDHARQMFSFFSRSPQLLCLKLGNCQVLRTVILILSHLPHQRMTLIHWSSFQNGDIPSYHQYYLYNETQYISEEQPSWGDEISGHPGLSSCPSAVLQERKGKSKYRTKKQSERCIECTKGFQFFSSG